MSCSVKYVITYQQAQEGASGVKKPQKWWVLAVGIVPLPEFRVEQQHFRRCVVLILQAALLLFLGATASGSPIRCQARIHGNPEQISLRSCVRLVEVEESFPAALWGNLALWQNAGAESQGENSH